MSDENGTQLTLAAGKYQRATVAQPKGRPTDSISPRGRVVSTGRTTGTVKIRVTTREVTVHRPTE